MKSGYTIRKIVICNRHEPLKNIMHLRGQSPRISLKNFVFENLIFDRGLPLAKKKKKNPHKCSDGKHSTHTYYLNLNKYVKASKYNPSKMTIL